MNKLRYRCTICKNIYPYFEGMKSWYTLDVLSEITVRLLAMLFPVLYSILLERIILGKEVEYLTWVIVGYLILQLMKSTVIIFQKNCQNKVNNTVYRRIRVSSLNKYFDWKFDSYMNLNMGDIKMTLEDAVNKLTAFQTQFCQYCMNGVFIVIMTILLFSINWRLAIVAFIAIPITFVLDHLVSCGEKEVNEILNKNDASWATWLDETLKGWKEIRVNQYEEKRANEFEAFQIVDETYFMTWLRYWVTRTLVIPKLKDEFIMQFVLYFVGGILMYYKYISIGSLLVFVQYYDMLSNSVKAVSASDANLQAEMPHYERILKHLRNDDVFQDGTVEPQSYSIAFENVSFRYPSGEKNVLQNLSFRIPVGDRVGFSGESGVGKSTILRLILGQLEPDEGTVKYGDTLLSDICKKKLYEQITYISQDAKLYNESILENLRIGNEDASVEAIKDACKRACIYDFIMSLPQGFETIIGENGTLISGGQRQRLLLAKALLRDTDIYILDEATSALDNQAEENIIETLKSIPRDKTVIVVAHKERFLEMCDYVIKIG